MINLIALSENDRRLLIALILVFILVLVILAYIGLLIVRIMKWQGKAADKMMHDLVITRVITDKKRFKKIGRKKNIRLFYKQAMIPMCLMVGSSLILLIYYLVTGNWSLNLFDYTKEGFGTICFVWDWAKTPFVSVFGIPVMSGWPPLINTPHWEWAAWASYIFVPIFSLGSLWFLVNVQCLLSRSLRLTKLSHTIFDQSLDNYRQSDSLYNFFNNGGRAPIQNEKTTEDKVVEIDETNK